MKEAVFSERRSGMENIPGRYAGAVILSLALAFLVFLSGVPYLSNINTDLVTALTSAYVNEKGTAEFKGDYLLGRRAVTCGRFYNYLFKGRGTGGIENFFARDVMRQLAAASFFFFFLGCFLIVMERKAWIPLGVMLAFLMMTPMKGYCEQWGVYFNLYGVMANYFNCFAALFIFWMIRYPGSVWLPALYIFVFANAHPTSMAAFAVLAAVLYALNRQWKMVGKVFLVTLAASGASFILNAKDLASPLSMTRDLAEFITVRRGERNFIFSWDNRTLFPSSLRSYGYILIVLAARYWPVFIAAACVFFRKALRIPERYITARTAGLFYAAFLMVFLSVAGTLFMRALLMTYVSPFFLYVEIVRIEKLSWPLFTTASFLTGLNIYDCHVSGAQARRLAFSALALLFAGMHFAYSNTERPVCGRIFRRGGGIVSHGGLISRDVADSFELMEKLRASGRSNIYAPGDDFLNEFLRIGLKRPAYFLIEDGGMVTQAGDAAVSEWLRRYKAVSSTDFGSPADIEKLLAAEGDLHGVLLPYDRRYEAAGMPSERIGGRLLIHNRKAGSTR